MDTRCTGVIIIDSWLIGRFGKNNEKEEPGDCKVAQLWIEKWGDIYYHNDAKNEADTLLRYYKKIKCTTDTDGQLK